MLYEDYFKTPSKDATITEKIAIIKSNYQIAQKLKDRLKTAPETPYLAESLLTKPAQMESNPVTSTVNAKLDALATKISLLDSDTYSDEELSTFLKKYLEEYNLSNWELKLKLYEEIIGYQKLIIELTSPEDLMELKSTISDLYRKINLLDALEEEQELLETATENNNIFFLTSLSENIYFFESIRKNVPKEYYPDFITLLENIKNGKFPGLKKLQALSYFEIKLFKIRLTFAKLSSNNYLIIDGFMKKEDTSAYYKSMLVNRNNQFLAAKEKYFNSMFNPDFINIHTNYYNDIIAFLSLKEKKTEVLSHV